MLIARPFSPKYCEAVDGMFKDEFVHFFQQCLTVQRLITNFCANILTEIFASNRGYERRGGKQPPIKCFDSLQEFVICFEKRSSLRFLNRIEASFHFPRAALKAKARIECVCMRIYIFQCSMQRLALPAHRPKMASHDGALQKEKITSRSKAIYSSISSLFPAFLRKQKNNSN